MEYSAFMDPAFMDMYLLNKLIIENNVEKFIKYLVENLNIVQKEYIQHNLCIKDNRKLRWKPGNADIHKVAPSQMFQHCYKMLVCSRLYNGAVPVMGMANNKDDVYCPKRLIPGISFFLPTTINIHNHFPT